MISGVTEYHPSASSLMPRSNREKSRLYYKENRGGGQRECKNYVRKKPGISFFFLLRCHQNVHKIYLYLPTLAPVLIMDYIRIMWVWCRSIDNITMMLIPFAFIVFLYREFNRFDTMWHSSHGN